MTDWLADFRTKVKEAAAPAGVPGASVFTKVRDQGKPLPQVVIDLVSAPRDHRMDGPQALARGRVQIACLADDAGESRAIAWAIIAGLPPGGWETASNRFDKVMPDEPVTDGEQTETGYIHRARFDAIVWHAPADGGA